MNRRALFAAYVLLASPLFAATAPSTSGTITKIAAKGRVTIVDDAGNAQEYRVAKKTKISCDGKKASLDGIVVAGACSRATKATYDPRTKTIFSLELASAATPATTPAAAPKIPPTVEGEVAVTDVLNGTISVRLGGGETMKFMVGDSTKILREADGASTPVALETVAIGDRVDISSKDGKTADEIHLRAAAR